MASSTPQDYSQPVAYDKDGNPLYAHPPQTSAPALTPPLAAQAPTFAGDAERHAESVKAYPSLNLSDGEYVVTDVRRHSIGLLGPVGGALFFVVVILGAVLSYPLLASPSTLRALPFSGLVLPALLLVLLVLLGGYVAATVYLGNKLYITNESAIQEIQNSLFARREQTIGLESIEDVSYAQTSVLQAMFDYGTVRLSTVGDENSYQLSYVAHPKQQVVTITSVIEARKS